MDDIEKEYLRLKGRFPVLFSIKGTTIQTETNGTPKPIKPIAGARITGKGKHFDKIKNDLIEVAEKNPDFKLTIHEYKSMQRIDRTKIQEVPIESADPCGNTNCDECNIGGCPHGTSPIIDADKTQAEHIRIQARIRKELK